MSDEKQRRLFEDEEWEKEAMKQLYGVEPEMTLQTARFATTENPLLTEYYQDRCNDNNNSE
ncbi:hypothetical protein L1999_24810 [Neobacillus drentensis]|uniref:hypothetical protein n=1 Tax=Neobacillus drentensis TaxID=220684 RepID=UPI001F2A81B6|nr:hypothetical protein [Neobacillus drentensis]ULT56232.1 hypothetical protein L1999_24810 [Neobacillus drentensis]